PVNRGRGGILHTPRYFPWDSRYRIPLRAFRGQNHYRPAPDTPRREQNVQRLGLDGRRNESLPYQLVTRRVQSLPPPSVERAKAHTSARHYPIRTNATDPHRDNKRFHRGRLNRHDDRLYSMRIEAHSCCRDWRRNRMAAVLSRSFTVGIIIMG